MRNVGYGELRSKLAYIYLYLVRVTQVYKADFGENMLFAGSEFDSPRFYCRLKQPEMWLWGRRMDTV